MSEELLEEVQSLVRMLRGNLNQMPPVRTPVKGVMAALSSALFLGLAPVFGRMAILLELPPLAVVAIRTTLAALLLLVVMVIFARHYLYIYPAGCWAACWLAGSTVWVAVLLLRPEPDQRQPGAAALFALPTLPGALAVAR